MRKELLDHGYLEAVEYWGSDERIVEAARMSTGKGFLGWGPNRFCRFCERTAEDLGAVGMWQHCSKHEDGALLHEMEEKPGDEKLLRYLWEHKHATPFEMAGIVVEVQAPIFVFREWHRHRTQCLAGDAAITCVSPTGSTYKRSIKDIFDLKHGGVDDSAPKKHRNGVSKVGTPVWREARRKNPGRTRVLPNCQTRLLRVLDEQSGMFTVARMVDVWESGVKPLFRLQAGAFVVRASAEHPFLTRRGWVLLQDLRVGDEVARMGKVASHERPIPPALRQGIGVWTTMMRSRLIAKKGVCHLCGGIFVATELELDHVVPVALDLRLALDVDNLKPACSDCHRAKTDKEQPSREGMSRRGVRWELVRSLPTYEGEEMTYDLEVGGAHHNYCANDLVVHNSYNELSARYTPLPDLNYLPSVERLLQVNDATKNRQASGTGVPLTSEQAEAFRRRLRYAYEATQVVYDDGLSLGVAKELARLPVPVARYSRMRASANLRNWLLFLTLRMDSAAMWEIRQYANAVGELIAERFPRTWQLFEEGRR